MRVIGIRDEIEEVDYCDVEREDLCELLDGFGVCSSFQSRRVGEQIGLRGC